MQATGRPVLVGTASVAESEELAAMLRGRRVKCRVLNARHDAREALIVSRAGMPGAVTISTNMAGRGTDIALGGGDPEAHAKVVSLGGLYVIGTNRHESRRVDDQLRGRSGRQGDPGSSRFFVSLEDDLIRRYGVLELIPPRRRPAPQDGPIGDRTVRDAIGTAQRIIEGQNFEIRKTLWRYSSMVEEQRQLMFEHRRGLLEDDSGPGVCAEEAPEQYAALVRDAGAEQVRDAERRLALILLDRRWSDHLALIDDIREGIHLQRFGGRAPLTEFQRQIIDAYAAMMEGLRDEVVETFLRLRAEHGTIDLDRAGLRGPTSTWTYLVNDNPLPSFGLQLIAPGNLAVSVATATLAVVYFPVTVAVVAVTFIRRWLRRRGVRIDAAPGRDDSRDMRLTAVRMAFLAAALAALPLLAQQPTFRAGVDVVKVDVSVARGVEHVSGLTAENFEVFDNGVKQKITNVAFAQVPLEVYLVLDLSGSVQGEALAQLKRAANALVDGLVPADRVALLTFSKTVTVRQELTSNFQAFKAALAEATPSGNTALYDAVLKAISMREPKDNRAIVVVFTDEGDNASTATTKQVVDAAERTDVTGYGVLAPDARSTGFGAGMGGAGLGPPQFQIGFLRSLADATGGRVFRASARMPLEDLFELVLDDARSRYVLMYSPEKTTPGWHKLDVKLVGAKGDVVARRGYFVGTPAGRK